MHQYMCIIWYILNAELKQLARVLDKSSLGSEKLETFIPSLELWGLILILAAILAENKLEN